MAITRFIVGKLIFLFDWVFTPRGIKCDPAQQVNIDQQTASPAL